MEFFEAMFSRTALKVPQEQVSLRVLTQADLNLLTDIERVERLCHRLPWDERSCRECFADTYKICALFLSDKLIGYAVIYGAMVTTDLLTIGVEPKYQGKGLGALLLEFTLRQAVEQNANECFLEVRVSNLKAQALYRKFGFVEVGIRRGYYVDPLRHEAEDAYTMANPDLRDTLYP